MVTNSSVGTANVVTRDATLGMENRLARIEIGDRDRATRTCVGASLLQPCLCQQAQAGKPPHGIPLPRPSHKGRQHMSIADCPGYSRALMNMGILSWYKTKVCEVGINHPVCFRCTLVCRWEPFWTAEGMGMSIIQKSSHANIPGHVSCPQTLQSSATHSSKSTLQVFVTKLFL